MDAQSQGQDAPSAVLEQSQQAADSVSSDDALPTSASDFAPGKSKEEIPGEKKTREIFRRLKTEADRSEGSPDDDEPADGGETATEQAGETEATASQAGKPADQAPASKDTQADGHAALSAARDALIRDGFSGADLDRLPAERVLELGSKRQSQQKQQDGFGRQKAEEIAQLKARLAELEPTAQQPGAAQSAQHQQSPAAVASDPLADPAFAPVVAELDKLGEYASPEVQDVMKKGFALMAQAMGQQIETRTKAASAQSLQLAEAQMLRGTRLALQETIPALKDEKTFSAVTQKMQALAKTGAYGVGDFQTLMQDAAKLVVPAPTIQDVQRKMLEESRKAKNGQMDTGKTPGGGKNGRTIGPEDQMRAAIKALKAGKSPDDARRAVRASA